MYRLIAGLAVLMSTTTAFAQEIPDEARKQLAEAISGPYIVFLGKVQDDLKLTAEQKGKLEEKLPDLVQDAMAFFQTMEGIEAAGREKKLGEFRRKAGEKLAGILKPTLKDDQLGRL